MQRQQEIACLTHFPVVWSWRWKSHLIINTVPVGAAVSSETSLFSSLMAVWEITGLEEMHSETQAHVHFHLRFDTSNLHTAPFKNYTWRSASLSEETGVSEKTEVEGVCATRVCARAERDLLILQEPNQKSYSFIYLIIQTEPGIINLHVINLSGKTQRKK